MKHSVMNIHFRRAKGRKKRQSLQTFLMAFCLFGWVGMALLHDVSHSAHIDEHQIPCAICRALPQTATAVLETTLDVRHVAFFEFVREIQTATIAFPSQTPSAFVVPRGPPALPFV